MNMLSSFLHPEKAYEKAQKEMEKYFQEGQGYLDPYNQYGKGAYTDINSAMRQLLNPAALESQWIKGYNESPSALQAEALAKAHGLDAASSLGLMGSSSALNAIQSGTSDIALNDRENYLNNLMNKYLAGVDIGKNIFATGANAANQMGQNAMTMSQNAAQTEYGKQSAPGSLFGNLIGAGLGLAGSYFGGPLGGAVGAKIGSMLSGGNSGWSSTGSYNSRGA